MGMASSSLQATTLNLEVLLVMLGKRVELDGVLTLSSFLSIEWIEECLLKICPPRNCEGGLIWK